VNLTKNNLNYAEVIWNK